MKSVVIIGSGNVATVLGRAFKQAGLNILAIYSSSPYRAKVLADELGTMIVSSLAQLPDHADLYILAIKDSAVREVSERLNAKGIVVHCSGTLPIDLLNKHKQYGVIWPLQTLTKESMVDFRKVPVCIDGNDRPVTDEIKQLTSLISDHTWELAVEQRKFVHLSAVFANNFANFMFDIAAQILADKGIPFDVLRPLIMETAVKAQTGFPVDHQTGPARRSDTVTIDQHMELLKSFPEYRQLYEIISADIRKRYR